MREAEYSSISTPITDSWISSDRDDSYRPSTTPRRRADLAADSKDSTSQHAQSRQMRSSKLIPTGPKSLTTSEDSRSPSTRSRQQDNAAMQGSSVDGFAEEREQVRRKKLEKSKNLEWSSNYTDPQPDRPEAFPIERPLTEATPHDNADSAIIMQEFGTLSNHRWADDMG